MLPDYLFRVLQVLLVLFVYTSAMFENIDIVDLFDYESDVFFEIHEPPELRFTYRIRPATNFGIPLNDSLETFSARLVPTNPPDCCDIPDNSYYLKGHVALVERGRCTFKRKALCAEEAGAVGVIIADYDHESDIYIDMLDDESGKESFIPAAFLLGKNGHIIKSTLKKLNRAHAEIRIPLNSTRIKVTNQPPWLIW